MAPILRNPVPGLILPPDHVRRPDDPKLPNGHPLFRVTQTFDSEDAYWRSQHPDEPPDSGPRHGAMDLGNFHAGDPVLAPLAGRARTWTDGAGALVVLITDPAGWTVVLAHLSSFSIPPGATTVVRTGQEVGLVGSTGLGAVNHLHVELKSGGVKYDPYPQLEQNQMALVGVIEATVAAGNYLRKSPFAESPGDQLLATDVGGMRVAAVETDGRAYNLGGVVRRDWTRIERGEVWWVATPLLSNARLTAAGAGIVPGTGGDCTDEVRNAAAKATAAEKNKWTTWLGTAPK